jgi:hypothetical protein
MAILDLVLPKDTDEDNNKVRISNVQFFFGPTGAADSALINYQTGRIGRLGKFKAGDVMAYALCGEEWVSYKNAMTKNIQKSAEDWLILKGICTA